MTDRELSALLDTMTPREMRSLLCILNGFAPDTFTQAMGHIRPNAEGGAR